MQVSPICQYPKPHGGYAAAGVATIMAINTKAVFITRFLLAKTQL
jgi:hypothetical protein